MTTSHIIAVTTIVIATPLITVKSHENEKLEEEIQTLHQSLQITVKSPTPIGRKIEIPKPSSAHILSKRPEEITPDSVHLTKNKRLDLLVEICSKNNKSIFPNGAHNVQRNEFNDNFEPYEGLVSLFNLSSEQMDALKKHGQITLKKVQQWESQNAEPIADPEFPDKVTYRIPSIDDQLIALQNEFKHGVQEIVGVDGYPLIEQNLERNFKPFAAPQLINFSVEEGQEGDAGLELFIVEIKTKDHKGNGRHMTITRALGDGIPSVEKRYAHLFEITSE